LTELLGYRADCSDVREASAEIANSKTVERILSQVADDGEWPWTDSYEAPEYGIGYLGELGLERSYSRAKRAIEVYLSKQYEDGSFPSSYSLKKTPGNPQRNANSCYYALTLRGLGKLGYRDDERVQKAIKFMLAKACWDGGTYAPHPTYVAAPRLRKDAAKYPG
jgi:hypothetical protein